MDPKDHPDAGLQARAHYRVEEQNLALLRLLGRPREVLDVGCGGGQNGALARARGAHVTGIERDPEARSRAARRLHEVLDLDVEAHDQLARGLGSRRFDLLLLADVLEHTRDPEATLRALSAYLADEGHVLISLPNVATWPVRLSLLGGRFDYTESGVLDGTHLRFFTLKSALELLARVGLEPMRVDHTPMLVRAAKDGIQRWLAPPASDPDALSRSLPYKLYQGTLRPIEDRLTQLSPGLLAFQHVILARKPPRPNQKLSLTVGMLTMDEEPSIARMIDAIRKEVPDAALLCVDSSTKDRTAEIAAAMGARVLRQLPARGHGPAMELLMYEAAKQSDALIYLDCDFTYPTDQLRELRRLLEEEAFDVVNCARTRSRPAAMPLPNYVANRAFAGLAALSAGVPTVDVHSGMRAYRSSVIRAFDFDGEGDALPVDTLLWPAKCGYHVVERPIVYDERVGVSKLRKVSGALWTLVRLGRTAAVGARRSARFSVR